MNCIVSLSEPLELYIYGGQTRRIYFSTANVTAASFTNGRRNLHLVVTSHDGNLSDEEGKQHLSASYSMNS